MMQIDTNPLTTTMIHGEVVNAATGDVIRCYGDAALLNIQASAAIRRQAVCRERELNDEYAWADGSEFAFDGCVDAPSLIPQGSYCNARRVFSARV